MLGDKYHLSIKDVTKNVQICVRQEIPNSFALYQVPVEDLEDPADVMENLRKRLRSKVRSEGQSMIEATNSKSLNQTFFAITKNTLGASLASTEPLKVGQVRVNKTGMMQGVEDSIMTKFNDQKSKQMPPE